MYFVASLNMWMNTNNTIYAPQGYYAVNGKPFTSKMKAFIYASTLDNPTITFHYFDELWDALSEKYQYNPFTSLEELYKIRAQQIRDTHDYVILNFSGGSDSVVILETFLKNKIKLDEIYVRWPKRLLNSGKYTPNNKDKSATNMLSEWDYSVEPKLEYVRRNFPEIKIVIDDWIDLSLKTEITEDLIFSQNHNFGIANYGFSEIVSANAIALGDKGLRVANIFGTDKPSVLYNPENDRFGMNFLDLTLMTTGSQHAHGLVDKKTRIDFYYAPDFPDITLARAYAVAYYFKNNPQYLHLIDAIKRRNSTIEQRMELAFNAEKIVNKVCYPSWDLNTFQVDKPNNMNKIYHPWFNYLDKASELDAKRKELKYKLSDLSAGIKDEYKNVVDNQMVALNIISTKWFMLAV